MSQENINKPLTFSVLNGITARFNIDGQELVVWGSSWTGMEKIWLNGELVSEKRSLRFKTVHTFSVDDSEYEVELDITHSYKSEVSASVVKDGAHLKTVTFNYYRDENGKFDWPKLFKSLLAGAVVGFSGVMIFEVLFK